MADTQTEHKAQLSDLSKIPAQEFEKHFQDWMERDDVARALQAKMRYDLIRSFNKTALGQQILSQTTTTTSGGSIKRLRLSPLTLALNTLVAEFLYAENCHFALSIFCTEVPYRNTLPDFESQRHFRFAEAEVFEILEAISAPSKPEAVFTNTVTKDYIDSKENPLLLLVLKVLLEQIDKPAMKFRDVATATEAENVNGEWQSAPQPLPAPPPPPPASPPESPRCPSDAEASLHKCNFRHLNKYLIMLSKKVKTMSQQFEWLQQTYNVRPAVAPLARPRAVQSVRTRRYEKLNRSLERITENLRKMGHAKRRSKHVNNIVSAIGALSAQFSKCVVSFESVSKQLIESRIHQAEDREDRQQEKTYADWVNEMRHTKNGQRFLERVETSLRKALGKQKELLRTEADMRMQHQKELLKIRYKHKVMQYASKHPTTDLCGEAQRLNDSVEYQLREFEARHVDMLHKMHGGEDDIKTAIKAAVTESKISIANAKSSNELAIEAGTALASGAASKATAAAASKATAGAANESIVGAASESTAGAASETTARAFSEAIAGAASKATAGAVNEAIAGAASESTAEFASEATTGAASEATTATVGRPAEEDARDGDTCETAAKATAIPSAEPTTAVGSTTVNVRATGGYSPITPSIEVLERNHQETAADKFVQVVRAKMRQTEIEKLEKLTTKHPAVSATPNIVINLDCGLSTKGIQKEVSPATLRKPSKTPLYKQKQISLEEEFKATPPAPPSTPTKLSNPQLYDAFAAQRHLQKMLINFAETDHSVDVMVLNAKMRLKELEFESNQLEQNFRNYLERQKVQTATVQETMASMLKRQQTDRIVTEESKKIIEQLKAMAKNKNSAKTQSADTTSASSPETPAYAKPCSSTNNENANINQERSTVEFRNAILEAKEKLFKRIIRPQPIIVPSLNLDNVASRTETEGDLSERLSAVEAYYYNYNFGRIESRSNVRMADSTSQLTPTSSVVPFRTCEETSTDTATDSNRQSSHALKSRTRLRKVPNNFKQQLLVSEKSSRTSFAAATVAKAMAGSAAAATAALPSEKRVTASVGTDVCVGTNSWNDNVVGTDDHSNVCVATGGANKNVTNTSKTQQAQPLTNIGVNSGNSHISTSPSSSNSGRSVHKSDIKEKVIHKKRSSSNNNKSDSERNGSQQQQQQQNTLLVVTQRQSNTSIALPAYSAPVDEIACASATSLMSATSMLLQQSMARMHQLFAEAPIARETALEFGELILDTEMEQEQWRRNVEQLQNIVNNNAAFVRPSAGGLAATGDSVKSEIAVASCSVNNNKSGNIAQQQTVARQQQQQQQSRAATIQSTATGTRMTTAPSAPTRVAVTPTTEKKSIAAKDNNTMKIAADCTQVVDCRLTKSAKLPTTSAAVAVTTAAKMATPTGEVPTSSAMLPTFASTSAFCMHPDNLSSISRTSLELFKTPIDDNISQTDEEEEEDEEEAEVEEEQQPMGHRVALDQPSTAQTEQIAVSSPSIDLQLSVGEDGGGQSDSGSDFW